MLMGSSSSSGTVGQESSADDGVLCLEFFVDVQHYSPRTR